MKPTIEHINESFVYLNTEKHVLKELWQQFSFRADNFQYSPKYKAGIWDGYIRLINNRTGKCPKGLVPKIVKYMRENAYPCTMGEGFEHFSAKYHFLHTKYNLPFEPYDYQCNAVQIALDKKRHIILSPTGSGKSLIQYLIMREYLDIVNHKILIVVPTISLVTQMFEDFKDYSVNNGFDVDEHVHLIYEGAEKSTTKKVIISTWQSIYNEPSTREEAAKESKRGILYFEDFDMVIGDEIHTFKSTSLVNIMEKCINAKYRIGVTGTLDDSLTNEMTLISLFGNVTRVATTAELMERGILCKLKINFMVLKYTEETCIKYKHADYPTEMDFLVTNEARNDFILNVSKKLNGNTLILVSLIEKHGKPLYKKFKEALPDKQVYFVYGGVEAENREKIRKLAEKFSDVIIIASYQCYSTGINIKNLNNVIFGSPHKSKIRILQSIGRGLRLHKDKKYCRIIDITDDLRDKKRKSKNYSLEHGLERLRLYQVEGFEVTENVIQMRA